MRYDYDPDTEVLTWLPDDRPSPVEGVTMAEYQRAVASIERSKRMTIWELIDENQQRLRQFGDLRPQR